jgi:hypothetical protein
MVTKRATALGPLGGTCSILLGISYAVFGVTYLLDPTIKTASQAEFYVAYAAHPTMYVASSLALALGAILALAVIPAVAERLRTVDEAWVRWASNVAYLGFAVTALANVSVIVVYHARATAYVRGDEITRAAVVAPSYALDPTGWFPLGCVGMWFLVINLLGLRGGAWPRPLAYLGLAGGVLYWCALAGNLFGIPLLFQLAAGLGGVILAPIWFAWVGLILRRPATAAATRRELAAGYAS